MNVHLITDPGELKRTDELFAIAFEQKMEEPQDTPEDKALHWAAFSRQGDMMSTFAVTPFAVHFDGGSCQMGGVGGVATLPQYRRQGGIRECFRAALPELYRRGFAFAYLYPFSPAYYRKFGFECGVRKLAVTLRLSLLKARSVEGVCHLAEPGRPMAAERRSLDEAWERRFNMAVCHTAAEEVKDPARSQEFCYVYQAADGKPKAYTVFRMAEEADGRNLRCRKLVFVDREGYDGLMGLFQSLAADHSYVKFSVPSQEALLYAAPEWSLGAASWSVEPAGMVRVIHGEQVLRQARYIGSGSAVIGLEDPWIQENNGSFRVCFREGRAVEVTRTEDAPDVELTIPAFSALITGACAFDGAVQWMQGVRVQNPNAPLERIFYQKPMWIGDYF